MENLNNITDQQVNEMINNLSPINTWLFEWDYDIGESYLKGHNEEISLYDDKDYNLFLMVKLDLKRDDEGYLIDDYTTIQLESLYDCNSNKIELTELQEQIILTSIVSNIN